METFLIRALQLIMSLSLLVIIHEGGHFLFSKLFKVRVEKFCIFFDPWFTLFKFKPKKSETEYGIGWLPLGGYVKIAGMIDESMDTEQMKKPAQPWEFRSKPAWQRLLIMVGGVLFNFILALFIYSMILFTWGDSYIPLKDVSLGMEFNETAKNIGFENGDILLTADGDSLVKYNGSMLRKVVNARQVNVLRGGKEATIYIPEDMMQQLMTDSVTFASYRFPSVIDSIIPSSPLTEAGIKEGDQLIAINGQSTVSHYDLINVLSKLKNNPVRNDSIDSRLASVTYKRGDKTATVPVELTSEYKLGFSPVVNLTKFYPVVNKSYSFFESFPKGAALGINTLKGYASDMKYLFSKEGAKQIGGFGTIGRIFPAQWDWHTFWTMTAFLSIILAFMNILPIPALDGGHVLFLLYEIIARRKPSDKFMEYAQMGGMILLLLLLVWANLNDVIRFFF